ncbi:cation:proton antiporter, partial [uncultured Dubosiella sp.]|uniref:cation:proton antiporter domain-containing protein n=1 Tax=uncultured Dubosiella sp. TaxID=1937011 RepID=UPI0025B4B00B
SVFSILRSQNLSLKYHTDSLLEVESGSNDPMSYMLVLIVLTMMKGGMSASSVVAMLVVQIVVGFLTGWIVFFLGGLFLRRVDLEIAGFLTIFIFACALASYGLASVLGGNGYLAVYVTGILMGNAKIGQKKELVHFFDGLSALMQIVLFFILGLLARPALIFKMLPVSFLVFLALSVLSRPLAVFLILGLKKAPWRQSALVSFAGLRGAASIVFAIMAMVDQAEFGLDVFHLVFGVVLFSIVIQGSLLPWAARKLDLVD